MLPQRFDFDYTHETLEKLAYFAGSGLVGEILSAPLERAKVVLQTKSVWFTKSFMHYKELNLTVKEIFKSEGTTGLVYGLKASVDKSMFFNIIRFYGYYYTLDYIFRNKYHDFKYGQAFLACLVGTSAATVATQTSDLLKIKIQSEKIGDHNEKLINSRVKVKKIVEAHGKQSILFAGLKANLLFQNVHALLELFTFFGFKRYFDQREIFVSPYTTNTVSIVLTNLMTTLIAAPLDYLHTKTVTRALDKQPSDLFGTFKQIWRQEGVGGFYKGYIPLLYKTIAMNVTIATILQYYYSKFVRGIMYDDVIQDELEHRMQESVEKYRN